MTTLAELPSQVETGLPAGGINAEAFADAEISAKLANQPARAATKKVA